MMSCGWLWLYAGAFLMLMEILTPGFVIFFFGLSAATTGILRLAVGGAFDMTWQLVSFSAFSIIYLVFLRRWLKSVFSGRTERAGTDFENEYVGRVGKVTSAINPPLSGRVEIGDAEWTAVADAPVASGANVKVVAQENLTMRVEQI
jgi:membrane protein implicated in regulation of membrane protease activity